VTSFFSIQHYSPLLVLGVGLSTFVGLWGLGAALLSLVRLKFPSPWDQVAALLLGIQTLSLAVQITGIFEITSLPVLVTIWLSLVVTGAVMLANRASQFEIPQLPHRWQEPLRYWPAALPLAIVAIAVTMGAFVALAPSTKADDLYYHMLVPSRIVSAGGFQFYREPWEAAIWPNMVFQISAAPAHALGYPDSVNIVSWALSATLLWFAWRIIRANANTPWSALCIGSLSVGLYPIVWHVSYSAHAMGDLALAAAIVAFCNRERLLASLLPWGYAALLSILLLSASSSKITLLPLSAILLCLGVWPLFKSAPPVARPRIALAILVPWIIFYGPIVSWTWIHSGSPFGPVLASLLESSIYPQAWTQQTFQAIRAENQQPLTMIRNTLVGYSPLIWLGAIGALFSVNLAASTRFTLGCLLALQSILIYWFLPYDLRFLSIHYGLFIVFACLQPRAIQERLSSGQGMSAVCVVFLLPWLAAQIYYAQQFIPVSLGLEKAAFYQRHIALYSDYEKLSKLLTDDTVLLCLDLRISSVYAPRPIFFNPADLPQAKSVALITVGEILPANRQFIGFRLGHVLYQNDHAILRTYRTPERTPIVGPLKVVTLSRNRVDLPQTRPSQ
jgi:hypothetical protein